MTRRRKLVFAAAAMTLAVVSILGLSFAADLYVHWKFGDTAGVNYRGYRGPVLGRKASGERRVVVLGESTVFGYGVHAKEAFPPILERLLNEPVNGVAPAKVSVANL